MNQITPTYLSRVYCASLVFRNPTTANRGSTMLAKFYHQVGWVCIGLDLLRI